MESSFLHFFSLTCKDCSTRKNYIQSRLQLCNSEISAMRQRAATPHTNSSDTWAKLGDVRKWFDDNLFPELPANISSIYKTSIFYGKQPW